ncbi:hypothetical protein EME81_28770 [Klebsiella pneumoniae]|nr:hypothetical protein [Klebsiella pneumoniae]NAU60720.1 hypothetical protein [Klebsiella pneumoniae]NAU83755.1 hypothetical protein [Klebsiella pneumoniae]NAU89360.1 hypothetical protein [Klebsiella pneumoniae]NAU94991.1 hypothetical protein [Klebsiella pneumoniae]
MPAFEWVHVQLHQQKGMISLSPPTICNSAEYVARRVAEGHTKMDAIRCLKRYISREVYTLLRNQNRRINSIPITA